MQDKVIVFDIKRFATHDGGGIRTTVFMKGCPLRCVWCQNPEGLESVPMPLWFKNRCIGCGTCTTPKYGAVSGAEGIILPDPIPDELLYACPTGAISMDSRIYTIQELLREAEKDRVFYRSGGGVTLSGGEPLLQVDAAAALLKALRAAGINTAMETSLFASEAVLEKVLPHLDLIYADVKLFDDSAHHQYTGVSNATILRNLQRLLTSQQRQNVIIRTPLIPTITATDENIAAISRHISSLYPDVRYELLNYNPLAISKYKAKGMRYCFETDHKPFTRAEMLAFLNTASQNGVKNTIIDL